MATMRRRITSRVLVPALAAFGLALFAAGAQAQQIDKIAVLVPEQGTDYGWNQQGVDAAREVGAAMGIEVVAAEGLGYGDVRPTLRELAAEGAKLMIAMPADTTPRRRKSPPRRTSPWRSSTTPVPRRPAWSPTTR